MTGRYLGVWAGLFLWPVAVFGQLAFENTVAEKKVDPAAETLEVSFPFSNPLGSPVKITKIASSCGCLRASADLDVVTPGEKGVVTGVFSVGTRTGTFEKKLTVETETGGKKDSQVLRLQVEVPALATVAPQLVQWDVGEEPVTKEFLFEVLREAPIRIESVSSSREEVRCEFEEVEPGRKYRLKVTPRSTGQPMMGIVRIETDCEIEKHRRLLAFFSVKRAPEQ